MPYPLQGCRTLKDVAKLPGLSEQQRVGLKYFDDFEVRQARSGMIWRDLARSSTVYLAC